MGTPPEQASRTVGGRAVLNEAIQVATADLESGGDFTPIVVTKDWGDCQVERFGEDEVERARTRMRSLLKGGTDPGHCALAYLEQAATGTTTIVIHVGRIGGQQVEAFSQRYRPRRGRFRPFKLIGEPSRSPKPPPPSLTGRAG